MSPFESLYVAAVDANPSGGAAIWEAVIATAVGLIFTLGLLGLGWAHRSGRIRWLGRLADRAGRLTAMPGWAGLPSLITATALIVAVFGMYWDISLHIGTGRDAGPFANPAHFFILAGLFGIFTAGFLALVLPEGRPSKAAVRLGEGWWAPLGAFGLLGASAFALLGFPLDDFWHRIFGQDVTLWGPTHLMMIGGASLAFVGQATLLGEAKAAEGELERARGLVGRIGAGFHRFRYALLAGGLLIGLSTVQAEFDFGVPQFRLLFGPVLIAFAAGTALVAARIYAGRGGALLAAGMFLAIRGALALTIGPILGEPMPHFPLYLGAAVAVELVALALDPRRRPYGFGLAAGALVGTVGLASEYAWSQLLMPIPWNAALLSEAALLAPLTAICGGLIGAFVANAWRAPAAPQGTPRLPALPAAGALVAVVAVVGYGLQTEPQGGVSASVALREIDRAPERTVEATVRIDPPAAAEDADWLTATAWQGGGLRVDRLERVGPGTWRTSEPLPVHGTWKSVLRLHKGAAIDGVPIYMPEDAAIPAPEVPAPASFERGFVADHELLQREQIDDVPGWIATVAYAVVGAIVLAIIALLGWSLGRLNRRYSAAGAAAIRRPPVESQPGRVPGGVPGGAS